MTTVINTFVFHVLLMQNRYLMWATTEGTGIRKQDGPTVLRAVAAQDTGNYVAFDFIREKWLDMRK